MIILSSLLYKPHIGGIENSLFHIAKIFQAAGHRVAIYVSDKNSQEDTSERLPSFEILDGIEIHRYKRRTINFQVFKILRPFFDIHDSFTHARKTFKKINVSLIINRNAEVGIGLNLAQKKEKSVYILPALSRELDKVHGGDNIKDICKVWLTNNFLLNLKHLLQLTLIKQSSFSIVFSKMMYNSIPYQYRKNYKVYVQPPGVICRKKTPTQSLPCEPEIVEKRYEFLIIGRIVEVKGIDIAIKAFSEIESKTARLLIVGEGPELNNLKDLCQHLSIQNRVEFTGITSQPEKYYLQSHFFVMSSTYETFGQTIIESMALGLPIVGFKSKPPDVRTATNEIVEDEVNGFLCDFSEQSLTKTFNRCLSLSKKEIKKISEANIKKVTEMYTWNALCDFVKKTE